MKKLILLLFIPLVSFSQEDIERYKVYGTENIYTTLLLDSATGKIWQLQIGLTDVDQLKTVLNDNAMAWTVENVTEDWDKSMEYWEETYNSQPDSIVSSEDKALYKPPTLKQKLEYMPTEQNGRFKLYPTGNMYNFIMVDVIDGRTWQVQWNTKKNKRIVRRFYGW